MKAQTKQFVVLQGVSGDGLVNTMDHLPQSRHLGNWETQIIEQARNSRLEWLEEHPSFGSAHALRSDWWKGPNHQLAILDRLPTPSVPASSYSPQVMGTLLPGTTIEALDLYSYNSNTFEVLPRDKQQPRMGLLQVVKVQYSTPTNQGNDPDSTQEGYVVWSIDGYNFIAPGTAKDYTAPWFWRVTCPLGALIRSGPSLSSKNLMTVPYGALVQVHAKIVNDLALSRLQVQYNGIWGWCSEFLNPLSGQRGPIAQPMPMLTPLMIRICLPGGAIVRESIELSSPSGQRIHYNEFVTVNRRVFSEHPEDACIQRLRLANGQGWISQCLNTKAREEVVDEATYRTVSSFDPSAPGQFHLDLLPNLPEAGSNSGGALSAVNALEASTHYNTASSAASNSDDGGQETPCVVCLTAERNATIVHGETGHVACCLVCARILKKQGDGCPVCRSHIDLVIQHFHA